MSAEKNTWQFEGDPLRRIIRRRDFGRIVYAAQYRDSETSDDWHDITTFLLLKSAADWLPYLNVRKATAS